VAGQVIGKAVACKESGEYCEKTSEEHVLSFS
jgi:hypothetical protein